MIQLSKGHVQILNIGSWIRMYMIHPPSRSSSGRGVQRLLVPAHGPGTILIYRLFWAECAVRGSWPAYDETHGPWSAIASHCMLCDSCYETRRRLGSGGSTRCKDTSDPLRLLVAMSERVDLRTLNNASSFAHNA